jgi:DNA-binding beta-propeller fold protein YncE
VPGFAGAGHPCSVAGRRRRETGLNTVVPISTATNKVGKPIRLASGCGSSPPVQTFASFAITPDGKTAYVACASHVVPISTATDTPGRPVRVPFIYPMTTAITP